MQFTRKKKRGQSAKTQRLWLSEEGYRIFWRKEVYGVELPPRFLATVRVMVPNYSQDLTTLSEVDREKAKTFLCWDFVDHKHHLYKTMKTAQDACEKHKRLWSKACEATGIRGLVEIFGKVPGAIPTWTRKKLSRKVYEVLTRPANITHYDDDEEEAEVCPTPEPTPPAGDEPSRPDPIKISPTLFKSTTGLDNREASTPVSPAEPEAGTTTKRTRRARSKATEAVESSTAPPAEEPAQAPKKRAAKPTKRRLPTSTRKPTSTKRSSKPAKKPSASSRKGKSKPSKS
jgi:hypothetical protein